MTKTGRKEIASFGVGTKKGKFFDFLDIFSYHVHFLLN